MFSVVPLRSALAKISGGLLGVFSWIAGLFVLDAYPNLRLLHSKIAVPERKHWPHFNNWFRKQSYKCIFLH